MLRECLDSIMRLSLRQEDREIILVDDGSDVSPINELSDIYDQLTYIRQPHQGIAVARNTGLHNTSGKYIQFVDGDDYLVTAPYEQCLDIARYKEPDMVMFHAVQKKHPEVQFLNEGPTNGVTYMRLNNLRTAVWGYIFRRAILGTLRFTPGRIHEDEEFTPQLMLRAEHIYSTKTEAYFYRKREGSIMTSHDNKHIAKRLTDQIDIIAHLQSIAAKSPEIDRVSLERRIAQLSMDHLYNTIKLTHSHHQLMEAIERLKALGLFPLPNRNYTRRYSVFRSMVNTAVGRRILLAAIR